MKIKHTYPPNWQAIKTILNPPKGAIYAYHDTIYNPDNTEIWPDLEKHEAVHFKQQNGDPENWWRNYLTSPHFRLLQEIEAYAAQYKYLKEIMTNQDLKKALFEMSNALSKDYGLDISYQEAENAIRKFS